MDGLASLVIGLTSFICSLGLATIPWLALSSNAPEGEEEAEYRAWLALLSGAAFLVSAFVLQSFGGKSRAIIADIWVAFFQRVPATLVVRTGIVLNAVDTLFVCFVVDCNTPNESRLSYQEEVHAAFVHKVPKIK